VGGVEALSKASKRIKQLHRVAASLPLSINCNTEKLRDYHTQPRLTEHQVDQLVAAHQSGASTYELGERFGVHRQTVGRHLKARGIDLTPGIDPQLLPTAARLYEAGWSLARIATEFDISAETLRTSLMKSGVKMRDPHERHPRTTASQP
jgi:DNA-binding transcriptional ArsR family regulator